MLELLRLSWFSSSISIYVPFATVLFSAEPQHILVHYSDLCFSVYTPRRPRVRNSHPTLPEFLFAGRRLLSIRTSVYLCSSESLTGKISFRLKTSSHGLYTRQSRAVLILDDQRSPLSTLSVATALHSSLSLDVLRLHPTASGNIDDFQSGILCLIDIITTPFTRSNYE